MSYPTQTPGWSPQRRALTAMSALDYVAALALGCSLVFWLVVYWLVLLPPQLPAVGVGTLIAIVMAVMTAIIPPLLWSMLVPTTPAGQLLQKTQWYTVGFVAIVGAALFLTYYCFRLLQAFWAANDSIAQSGEAGTLTIFCIICFVLVPALAWTVVTPERWLIQIHQDREVRRIERMRNLEDVAYKAMIARTRAVLNAELAGDASRLVELTGLLMTSQKLTNESIRRVATGYEQMYDVELRLGLENDQEMEKRFRGAVNHLISAQNEIPAIDLPAPPELSERPRATASDPPVDRAPVARPNQETSDRARVESGPPRPATALARSTAVDLLSAPARQNYLAAREKLDGAWKRSQLEDALAIEKTEALERIGEWKRAGLVVDVTAPMHHYRFIEAQ